MSLATRCNACGTLFRVVQDQLRVSDGWVRCGRCDTVFHAMDTLVDLQAEGAEAAVVDADPGVAEAVESRAEAWAEQIHVDAGSGLRPAAQPSLEPRPATALDERESANEPDDRGAPPPSQAPAPDTSALLQAEAVAHEAESDASAPLAPATAPIAAPSTPTFLRRAERDARWTTPAMRAALLGAALMLATLLALQAIYHFRDDVAARSAGVGDMLRGACARWGCRIDAPRRLHEVTLENSALSRVPQRSKVVRLSINLRNRGSGSVALPSVDLSLTDAKGQLIARRALSPSDFRISPPLIARNAELPLEAVLSAGESNISGYTVELFYP